MSVKQHMITVARIYGLVNPVSGKVFYIGQTRSSLRDRLARHMKEARGFPKRIKSKYINNILWLGKKPEIIEISTLSNCTPKELQTVEQAFIDFYRASHDLVNVNDACINRSSETIDWEPYLNLLGTMSDLAISRKMKVDKTTVAEKRRSLGIPPYVTVKSDSIAGWNKKEFSSDIIDLMGTIPDRQLAKIANVEKSTITRKRNKLGIKSYAELTGNNGTYKNGNFPDRWIKKT